MTEKQKGMFLLYEIPMQEGLSKRDAAILIDRAINTTRPSIEGQRKASAVWGNYRLTKIIEEMTKAIEVLGDEATTVKKLKDTKRKVKEVVQSFTEMIDKRIETIQVENREIRYEKTDEWLKKRGF